MRGILPAIVTSMPSEELAVVKLLDELVEGTVNINWYFGARLHVSCNFFFFIDTFLHQSNYLQVEKIIFYVDNSEFIRKSKAVVVRFEFRITV